MTENEIINRLHLHGKTMTQDEAFFIMDALEEIQQYRAIGTVEEFKENKDFLEFLYNHIPPNEMEQYLSMYHTKDKTVTNGYADQCGLMSAT